MESLTKAHRKKIINLGLDYLFLKKKNAGYFQINLLNCLYGVQTLYFQFNKRSKHDRFTSFICGPNGKFSKVTRADKNDIVLVSLFMVEFLGSKERVDNMYIQYIYTMYI